MDGKTVLTGLLGRPVAHSISPQMHNTAFEALGLNYAYLCFDIGEEELPRAVEGLVALGARGWNCTMPDKNRMAELVDELRGAAAFIHAVNTVVNENGRLVGYITDGSGYMRSVREAGCEVIGRKMTLLGTGGAATAILTQAALDGVAEIAVFSRPGRFCERAKGIIAALREHCPCDIHLHDYSEEGALARQIADSTLLVNGTSVGMEPDVDRCLIEDPAIFHPSLTVSDVIYHPARTKLLRMAEEAGCANFNGLYMLLYQGAEAFRLWTGEDMPVPLVRERCFV